MLTSSLQERANTSPEAPVRNGAFNYQLGHTMVDGFMHDTTGAPPLAEEALNPPIVVNREIPGMPFGLYNAGVWEHTRQDENGEDIRLTMLLGRLPNEAGAPGEGDPGPIVLSVMKDGAVISTQELWRPEQDNKKGDQLEDARVVVTPEGDVIIGLTRLVYDETDGKHHPFPAVAVTTSEALLAGNFPDTCLIEGFGEGEETTPLEERRSILRLLSGKNATPLEHKKFMFRQEIHNHALTLVSLDENNQAELLQIVDFPQDQIPSWCQDKMGTTMPPVWLNDREALFMVHGFTYVDGKPQYAIGSARLSIKDGKYFIDNISSEPLLTPQGLTDELFPGTGNKLQLHPEERSAMYMCGGVVINDENGKPEFIKGYVSIGDSVTVESTFSVGGMTSKWVRSENVDQASAYAA